MADPSKGDGAGMSKKDLSELSDSFKTIAEIFDKLAKVKKPESSGEPVGAGYKHK